jgi:hypothetical protein
VEAAAGAWYNLETARLQPLRAIQEDPMAKPHRKLKKANHGARPANSKARKMKRKHIRT